MRRETEPYRPDRPIVPELAAGAVLYLSPTNDILLLYETAEERWCFPKGHVEAEESLAEAAIREVREETGTTEVALGQEIGEVTYRFFDPRKGRNVLKTTVYFRARTSQSELRPEATFSEYRWVDPKAAAKLVAYETDRRILLLAQGATEDTGQGSAP